VTLIFVLTWSCDVLPLYVCIIWPCDVQISMIVLFKLWYCITSPFHPGPSAGSHFFHQKLEKPRFRLENVNHWLEFVLSHILDHDWLLYSHIVVHVWQAYWMGDIGVGFTQTTFRDYFKTVKLLSSFQTYLVYCDIKLKRIRLYRISYLFIFLNRSLEVEYISNGGHIEVGHIYLIFWKIVWEKFSGG